MSEMKIAPIVDPRGQQPRVKLALAPRPTLAELQSGRVLFYDNTKLAFCNYSEAFSAVKRHFRRLGITDLVDRRETVRGKSSADLRDTAVALAAEGFAAAVVALADMGTSPATTVLAIELERAGVPTVLLGAPPGGLLAKQVAFYRAGNLCICMLDVFQASTQADVAGEVDKHIQCITDALTLPAYRLPERARIEPTMDAIPPSEDGLLHIVPDGPPPESDRLPPGLCLEETQALFDSLHLGDGLPVVPPTPERVAAMMAYCPFEPDQVLISEAGPSGRDLLVRDVVVNAVLAGCKPQYVPVLITAFQAMANPKYNFLQSVTTSHAGGSLVLVSGPIAQELGIHGGQGCLGPGFRPNATIGRAANLTILHACRAVPRRADLGCVASPAEYSYCFAEEPARSPWPLINEERFDDKTTTVLVLKADPPNDVIDFLSQSAVDLLDTFIDSCTGLGKNNAYIPGNVIVVMTPDHARMASEEGWDKPRLRRYLHQRVHNHRAMVADRGIVPVRPAGFDGMSPIPATRSPDDFEIVVAGGRGGHSAVITAWGLRSEAIVEPLRLPDGRVARHIEDFRSA
jgi:hypothetical protein